jgi:hypothetical protein
VFRWGKVLLHLPVAPGLRVGRGLKPLYIRHGIFGEWKNTKKKATHLKYFKRFNELRASVLKAFRTLS